MAAAGGDIAIEHSGEIALVWFDRPERLNAFRSATFTLLHAALDRLATEHAVAALVMTGRGRAFRAGEDLEEAHGAASGGFLLAPARRALGQLQDLTRKVLDYPKPIVAAINGPAVGLGAELALACDLRIAAAGSYLAYPEVRRGMIATNGAFHLLPLIVGLGRATEWLMTGRRIGAEEARDAGAVAEVVGEGDLLDRAVELARRMGRPVEPVAAG